MQKECSKSLLKTNRQSRENESSEVEYGLWYTESKRLIWDRLIENSFLLQ